MTSLLDTARRLVQLGEAATNGPWHAVYSTHGDPFVCLDRTRWAFTRVCATDVGTPDYGRANNEFIAAARSADRLAAALLTARDELARLVEIYRAVDCTCAHGLDIERAETFLASLNAKPGDAS